ncbi:MAG: hypothetical protein DCC55_09885 [Chloroflexi bacterium]|nr:MAG: hypothetical protein DCC55_09885 [Chloroflexota bacterium]
MDTPDLKTRLLALAAYLLGILLFTGPIVVREVWGVPVNDWLPSSAMWLLLVVNLVPVDGALLVNPNAWATPGAVWPLPVLMGVQLWPLLIMAARPSLLSSTAARRVTIGYSMLLLLFWLIVGFYFSLPSNALLD